MNGGVLGVALTMLGVAGGTGCRAPAAREVERSVSPDGKIEAVLLERLTDATVSTPFELYMIPRGGTPKDEYIVLRIDRSSAPHIQWLQANEIAVRCDGARIWDFRNFATIRLPDDSFWSGNVMLACGVGVYEDRRLPGAR
jgi:hypothetical protein